MVALGLNLLPFCCFVVKNVIHCSVAITTHKGDNLTLKFLTKLMI